MVPSFRNVLILSTASLCFFGISLNSSAKDEVKMNKKNASEIQKDPPKTDVAADEKKHHSKKKHYHKKNHNHASHVPSPVTPVKASMPTANQHEGFWQIPGSDSYIKVFGYAKLDATYDANNFTGDASLITGIPLRNWDVEARRHGMFYMHAKQSRLGVQSISHTGLGELSTLFEFDFFGSNNFSGLSRASTSLGSFNARLRKAYGKLGGWLIGQDSTTFYDTHAFGRWIEFNGPNSISRHAMIRYEHKINTNWTLQTAAEFTPTDYTNEAGVRQEHNAFLLGGGGSGFRSFPDLIINLQYKGTRGHVKASLLGRELAVKRVSLTPTIDTPNIESRLFGWGVALSGRWNTYGKNSLFAQWNFGRGIGSYLFDAAGQAAALRGENFNIDGSVTPGPNTAALRAAGTKFRAQYAYCFVMGYEHYWTENLSSNIAYAHTQITPAQFTLNPILSGLGAVGGVGAGSGVAPVTKTMRHLIGNIIWSPIKKFEIGLEFAHYRRETTGRLHGLGTRIQLGVTYKF